MLDKSSKIYVAGHNGLVGSAIWNNLKARGYDMLYSVLDLASTRSRKYCALLSDAFEAKTIVCAVPEGKEPPELDALLSFYAPLTERIVIPTKIDTVKYFLMQNGKLEEIKGI